MVGYMEKGVEGSLVVMGGIVVEVVGVGGVWMRRVVVICCF